MKCHYQIEYYNNLWKDWIAFDQLFYKTEEQAQKRVNEYTEHKLGIKTRIVQTTILTDKPKRSKKNSTKVTTEKIN